MTLEDFNSLSYHEAKEELLRCCGATKWADHVAEKRPYSNEDILFNIAERVWSSCKEQDYLEAFSHHPKIGDVKSLKKKFASTATWASGEQKSVESANSDIIYHLAEQNEVYELKFGYIFIVCATGKTAKEMLQLLEDRLHNLAETEIEIAAAEQHKITMIRLKKLLS